MRVPELVEEDVLLGVVFGVRKGFVMIGRRLSAELLVDFSKVLCGIGGHGAEIAFER